MISGFKASTCIDVGTDAGNTLLLDETETLEAIGSFALAWTTDPMLCAIDGPPAAFSISPMVGSRERE